MINNDKKSLSNITDIINTNPLCFRIRGRILATAGSDQNLKPASSSDTRSDGTAVSESPGISLSGSSSGSPEPELSPVTILCYGDSNTYGYNPANGMRFPASIRWTGLLQRQLGSGFAVLEEGCNGRTATAVPWEEPWKVASYGLKSCLNSQKPVDIIILNLGVNDLKTRFNTSAGEVADGIQRLVLESLEFLKVKQGYPPHFIIVSPAHLGEDLVRPDSSSPFAGEFDEISVQKSKELAGLLSNIADKTGSSFIDAARFVEYSSIDSLHLSPESHAILSRVLAKAVTEICR